MQIQDNTEEFTGLRSDYYKQVMIEFPEARQEELELALRVLNPQKGEKLLEIGAGSGFFSRKIAQRVAPATLIASDPSLEQLEGILSLQKDNINIVQGRADALPEHELLKPSHFDGIWSGGSMHHVVNKTAAFQRFQTLLKPQGRLVISDVFSGSSLARHFDLEVAKYCLTGHEVAFLSREFTDSLCYLTGFERPTFYDAHITWNFAEKGHIGIFLYKIHAMTHSTPEECLHNAENILGIEYKNGLYCLNWPLTILSTRKL